MIALVTIVAGRHEHLRLQLDGVRAGTVRPDIHVVVSMGDPEIAGLCGPHETVLDLPASKQRLPVAAARNAGARRALELGADVLIFLDVDCVPSPTLVARYGEVACSTLPDALLSGGVRYLPAPPPGGYLLDTLATLAEPHPARPEPAADAVAPLPHTLFWSLSFGLAAQTWSGIGGFCELYEGYGGEDTDFAETARTRGVEHVAIGGATAFHQWHPSPDPPLQHLDDIVRNARIFHGRWGWWPMQGWLEAFAQLGLTTRDRLSDDWVRSDTTTNNSRPHSEGQTHGS